jgi:hypothetical protein
MEELSSSCLTGIVDLTLIHSTGPTHINEPSFLPLS